jgi:hypothetical protein
MIRVGAAYNRRLWGRAAGYAPSVIDAAVFGDAVLAVVDGDEAKLRALLAAHPELVRARSETPQRATLLHYLGANNVDPMRSPKNAPAIARILLEAGAEVDARAPIYDDDTTLCMVVTSVFPWQARVQSRLVDVLADHGAAIDGVTEDGSPLGCALLFGYTHAAERLAVRGARADNIVYAAGQGRTDVVRRMLADGSGTEGIARRKDEGAGCYSFPIPRAADARAVAMMVAAIHDRVGALRLFLDAGFDVNTAPYRGITALHYAAELGCMDVLDELLARGADPTLVEDQRNRTAIEWAGAQPEIVARLEEHARSR